MCRRRVADAQSTGLASTHQARRERQRTARRKTRSAPARPALLRPQQVRATSAGRLVCTTAVRERNTSAVLARRQREGSPDPGRAGCGRWLGEVVRPVGTTADVLREDARVDRVRRPTGMVAFLFTDVEGSTRLWERHPGVRRSALARHDVIVRSAIEEAGGRSSATQFRDSLPDRLRQSDGRHRVATPTSRLSLPDHLR